MFSFAQARQLNLEHATTTGFISLAYVAVSVMVEAL